jgi:hypothetical protein
VSSIIELVFLPEIAYRRIIFMQRHIPVGSCVPRIAVAVVISAAPKLLLRSNRADTRQPGNRQHPKRACRLGDTHRAKRNRYGGSAAHGVNPISPRLGCGTVSARLWKQ